MKKILLLLSVFALFSCEQEELDGLVDGSKAKVEQRAAVGSRAASSIADFDPVAELDGIPVNILNVGNTKNKYLSCVENGTKVDLYNKDDGSLRQRWYIKNGAIQLVGGNSKSSETDIYITSAFTSIGGSSYPLLLFKNVSIGVVGIPSYNWNSIGTSYYNITSGGGLFPSDINPLQYFQSESSTGTSLKFTVTNPGALAQWEIKPLGEFEIIDMQYVKTIKDELDIQNLRVYTRTFMNEQGEMSQKHTLTINETLTNKSQFSVAEGVSVKVSSGLKISIPKVADLNFGTDSNKSWTYTTVEEETKTATVQDVHEVEIPPYSNYRINVYVVKYKMNISYVATLRNVETKQIFKIKGKWLGQLCDINDIIYETVNLGTGKVVSTYSRKANTK